MSEIMSRPYSKEGEEQYEYVFGKIIDGVRKWKCENCNYWFTSKEERDNHLHQPIH